MDERAMEEVTTEEGTTEESAIDEGVLVRENGVKAAAVASDRTIVRTLVAVMCSVKVLVTTDVEQVEVWYVVVKLVSHSESKT